jgi:hypothetical protein
METWLDRKHHCSEKVAYLLKYIDLIGYIGIFGSALEMKTAFQFAVVLDNRLHCTLVLNGVNNTRSSGRIAKKRPPIANNRQLPARQVKVEEDIDTKSLLQSLLKPSKVPKSQNISQEQINQLSHYIVNDNMSIHKASIEVNISEHSGCKYFHNYINDPEKKIPSPLIRDT